jgi:hypothetical protein
MQQKKNLWLKNKSNQSYQTEVDENQHFHHYNINYARTFEYFKTDYFSVKFIYPGVFVPKGLLKNFPCFRNRIQTFGLQFDL